MCSMPEADNCMSQPAMVKHLLEILTVLQTAIQANVNAIFYIFSVQQVSVYPGPGFVMEPMTATITMMRTFVILYMKKPSKKILKISSIVCMSHIIVKMKLSMTLNI